MLAWGDCSGCGVLRRLRRLARNIWFDVRVFHGRGGGGWGLVCAVGGGGGLEPGDAERTVCAVAFRGMELRKCFERRADHFVMSVLVG